MTEFRCKKCHKLLFTYVIDTCPYGCEHKIITSVEDTKDVEHIAKTNCTVDIKCGKCKTVNKIKL
jgi:phage FluMu protein Com